VVEKGEKVDMSEGQRCYITCKTDTLDDAVSFHHPPGTSVGSCPVPGKSCIHGRYILTQNVTEKLTNLTIPFYSKKRDDGGWICNYRGNSSNMLNISGLGKCRNHIEESLVHWF